MKRFGQRLAAVGLAAAAGLTVLAAAPPGASAGHHSADITRPSFCTGGSAVCLNDWNNEGGGSDVRIYRSGVANSNFVPQDIGRCGGTVTRTCPFADTYFDRYYRGYPVVQLKYRTGECVGRSAIDLANIAGLRFCNLVSTGRGGGFGTVFVDHLGFLINVYETGQDHHLGKSAACMQAENPGAGAKSSVALNRPTASGCDRWSVVG